MAGKKVYGVENAVAEFKSVMGRSALDQFYYVNNTLVAKSPKGYRVAIIPDQELWLRLINDEEFKKQITELQPTDALYEETKNIFLCANEVNGEGWIEVPLEDFFAGKVIKIEFPDPKFLYSLSINKDCFPLKLRKSEQNQVSYRPFLKPENILAVKKRFVFKELEQYGWTIMRLYLVI